MVNFDSNHDSLLMCCFGRILQQRYTSLICIVVPQNHIYLWFAYLHTTHRCTTCDFVLPSGRWATPPLSRFESLGPQMGTNLGADMLDLLENLRPWLKDWQRMLKMTFQQICRVIWGSIHCRTQTSQTQSDIYVRIAFSPGQPPHLEDKKRRVRRRT